MLTKDVLEFFAALFIAFPAAMLILVLTLRRVILWLDERGYIFYTGNPSTYGSLGNSFLELQHLAQPEIQYLLEAKDDEDLHKEDAGVAGSPDTSARSKEQ
jgi:hypothetical protein